MQLSLSDVHQDAAHLDGRDDVIDRKDEVIDGWDEASSI